MSEVDKKINNLRLVPDEEAEKEGMSGKALDEEFDGNLGEEFDGNIDEGYADSLPSSGLLSFYDRLRRRMIKAVEKRGGKWGTRTAEALLLVPDVFMLLTRLALDKEVPKETRALVASALAYFLLPFDLMPEAIVGPVGFLDDLILALAVLSQAFSGDLEPFVEKYWSGSKRLRTVMRDTLHAADRLLGNDLYSRLKALLSKRGIDLDQA